MKKRFFWIILFAVLLAFSSVAIVACGDDDAPRRSYTVTFVGTDYDTITVKEGDRVALPEPTSEGKTFVGWFYDETWSDRYYGEPIKSDIKLYPYFSDDAVVKFRIEFFNDSDESEKIYDIIEGGTLKYSQFPILERRDGYVAFWQSGDEIINGDIIGVDRNMSIRAVYENESAVRIVTFDSTGGSSVNPQTVKVNQKAAYPVEPHKSEMYFAGWYTDKTYDKKYDFNSAVVANITLYALWSDVEPAGVNGEIVKFDAPKIVGDFNGWDFNVSQESDYRNGRYSIKFNTYCDTRAIIVYSKIYKVDKWTYEEAYNFSGQRIDESLDNASRLEKNADMGDYYTASIIKDEKRFALIRSLGGSITPSYDADSGVLQIRDVHKVRFDTTGGSSVSTQYISHGDKAITPEETTRLGYIFDGWSDLAVGSGKIDVKERVINADTVFSAKWKEAYVVTFDSTGGTEVPQLTVAKDSAYVTQPSRPEKSNSYFIGWYTDATCATAFNFKKAINENITLYAKWGEIVPGRQCIVTFDYNGGTVSGTQSVTESTVSGGSVSPLLYSPRFGKQYMTGWYWDELCQVPFDFSEDEIYADTTLYAGYAEIPNGYYAVYFDCSHRLPKIAEVGKNVFSYNIISDNRYTVLRSGYQFMGWHSDAACTVDIMQWPQGKSGEIVTMYAAWEKVEMCTFTYHNYDNSVFKTVEYAKGDLITYNQLAKPDPRTGYVFKGWYLDQKLTTRFPDSDTVKGNVDLYPAWEEGVGVRAVFYNMDGSVFKTERTYEGYRTKNELYSLADPEKSGYVFIQWFLDKERTYPVPETYNVSGDIALYGSWVADKSAQVTGEGTSLSPYLVSTYEQFASHLLKGEHNVNGIFYRFTANVNFTNGNEQLTDLYASVDFDGHSVTGITRPLFENVMENAQVVNAKMTANITLINGRTSNVGIVCCTSAGYIARIWTLGVVDLPNVLYVGGVTGSMAGGTSSNRAIIENCLNSASITAKDYAGGIAGSHSSRNRVIRYCVNEGEIHAAQGTYNDFYGKYYKHGSGVVGNSNYDYRIIGCITTTDGDHENSGDDPLAGSHSGGGLKCPTGLPDENSTGTIGTEMLAPADLLKNWLNFRHSVSNVDFRDGTGAIRSSYDDEGGPELFTENGNSWYYEDGHFRLEYFRNK